METIENEERSNEAPPPVPESPERAERYEQETATTGVIMEQAVEQEYSNMNRQEEEEEDEESAVHYSEHIHSGSEPQAAIQDDNYSPHKKHPMDHLNEESTGSGLTSIADSNESSTHNHMDDSLEVATEREISGDKEPEDMITADLQNQEQAQTEEGVVTPPSESTPVSKKKSKETAAKRFKCSHCSKSYVREFQLNTHVRKYHPEKPAKGSPNKTDGNKDDVQAGSPNATPVKATWTQADMDEALEALKTERMSLVKASQHYGIPASTLWQRATKLGIMIPKNGARTSSKDGVADAVQLLKTGQISVNKASKVFGIPPSTLYKIAKREGIQLSSPFNSATTSWTQENLQLAMDAIRTGQMSVHMASVEFKIPPGTLYGRCKREGLELSRNNPVQWSPRDLKNALEAVKTGHMSINQASEHFKISYSSLYKRVKPHFVPNNNNNNNNSNSSNQNLPKLGNDLGETDLQVTPLGAGGPVPVGMDNVTAMHHPMDYETHPHRSPHIALNQSQQQQHNPQPNALTGGLHMQYGSSVQPPAAHHLQHHLHHHHHQLPQQQQQQPQSHYLGQPPTAVGQQLPQQQHHQHHLHHQAAIHHYQQQHAGAQPQSLPVIRQHPQQHHAAMDDQPPGHPQQQQMMHVANGHLPEDARHYGDVDKHGLTSSSGIGLNGLMGISMGFLDFAPELPAPVAVPVTEHYSVSSQHHHHHNHHHQQQQQLQLPYSSVITKDNSGARQANNGNYNGSGGGGGESSSPGHAAAVTATATIGHHPGGGTVQTSATSTNNTNNTASNSNNNGYATLQNNYYHHSVIHSPVQLHHQQQQQQQAHLHHQQQQQQHHSPQQIYGHQQHLQMQHANSPLQHHPHLSSSSSGHLHHHPGGIQRHGMVPMNEDKRHQKEVLGGGLIDPHAATAEYEDKVIVTTINDL